MRIRKTKEYLTDFALNLKRGMKTMNFKIQHLNRIFNMIRRRKEKSTFEKLKVNKILFKQKMDKLRRLNNFMDIKIKINQESAWKGLKLYKSIESGKVAPKKKSVHEQTKPRQVAQASHDDGADKK